MERKSIGSFIAALRKANGFTQKELAEMLNVSDKAVSRWERDESAPDISLLPVIAEIFEITTDELLCGERKRTDSQTTIKPDKNPRANLQIKNLLISSMNKFKSLSLISLGISATAILTIILLDHFVHNNFITAICTIFLLVLSVVCEIIFISNFMNSTYSSETENELINTYKVNVINYSKNFFAINFYILFVIFVFACIPLISDIVTIQTSSTVTDWLFQLMLNNQTLTGFITTTSYSLFFILAAIILGIFAYLLFKTIWLFVTDMLSQKQIYPIDEATQKKRKFIKRFFAVSLTVITLTLIALICLSAAIPNVINITFTTETESTYSVTQSGFNMSLTVFAAFSIFVTIIEYIVMALVYLLLTRKKKHSKQN